MEYTIQQIDVTIARASKISFDKNAYMKRKLNILKDIRSKMDDPSVILSEAQVNFVNALMSTFSDETLSREENWSTEWKNNPESIN